MTIYSGFSHYIIMVIFHSYVKLPEGNIWYAVWVWESCHISQNLWDNFFGSSHEEPQKNGLVGVLHLHLVIVWYPLVI